MEIEAGTVETAEATCIRCGEVRPCVTWPVQRLSADSEPVEETVCMTCVMPVTPEEFGLSDRCAHGNTLGECCIIPWVGSRAGQ